MSSLYDICHTLMTRLNKPHFMQLLEKVRKQKKDLTTDDVKFFVFMYWWAPHFDSIVQRWADEKYSIRSDMYTKYKDGIVRGGTEKNKVRTQMFNKDCSVSNEKYSEKVKAQLRSNRALWTAACMYKVAKRVLDAEIKKLPTDGTLNVDNVDTTIRKMIADLTLSISDKASFSSIILAALAADRKLQESTYTVSTTSSSTVSPSLDNLVSVLRSGDAPSSTSNASISLTEKSRRSLFAIPDQNLRSMLTMIERNTRSYNEHAIVLNKTAHNSMLIMKQTLADSGLGRLMNEYAQFVRSMASMDGDRRGAIMRSLSKLKEAMQDDLEDMYDTMDELLEEIGTETAALATSIK